MTRRALMVAAIATIGISPAAQAASGSGSGGGGGST